MKVKKVTHNNRKKAFEVTTTSGEEFHYPYSRCETIPSENNPVVDVYPDSELGREGFEYVLEKGQTDSVLMDSVLDYNGDPEYVKKARLYKMTCQALEILDRKKTPKNELTRRMGCTKAHLNRLLDAAFYGKSTDEMIRLLNALDYEVEIKLKKVS